MRKLLFIILLIPAFARAQPEIVDREKYPFIKYEANTITTYNPLTLLPVFRSLERLLKSGDRQINIVQIGDSHIQADVLSSRMREKMQDFFPGGNGGRGFIFPYSVAKTNNPWNYKVDFTGKWESCRNIQTDKDCLLGLSGISVTTMDSFATISILQPAIESGRYDFTRIRIFYGPDDSTCEINLQNIPPGDIISASHTPGIMEWNLSKPVSNVVISFKRIGNEQCPVSLYGIAMETRDPGIVYHAVGVNGAQISSFLRCKLLPTQLHALNPDLVIVSLGTNDAYVTNFDTAAFKNNYQKLLSEIKEEIPGVPVLLTTPGDCYFHNRFANPNNITARKIIMDIAKENNYAVWDFLGVMGGLGSINTWFTHKLTAPDKVHYNITGYKLQGDLFLEAFVKAFDDYVDKKGGK